MAETIGFALIAAATSATGTTVVASAATASIIGQVAITTALVGGSMLFQSLSQPKQRNETQQSVLNQAMGARVCVYGRTLAGGSRYLFETRNGALFQGIIISAREIDRIEAYYIGDRKTVTTLGEQGGIVTDFPQINKVSFEPHYGTDDQVASPTLLSQLPGIWTADHRLRGLAHVVVVFLGVKREEQQIVYPQGYATPLRFLVRGAKVWDPTNNSMDPEDKASWAWSENSGDCILDYLRHRDGMRFARSRIDVPSFADFHGLCAEVVARKDGSTEPRYRLGGTYALNEAPKDVLARMLSTCDGQLVRGPTGLIGIRGGRFRNPLVNIPTEQIIAADLTQGNDRLDAYNLLKVSYTEPENFYQPTEIQARQDLTSQAQVGVIDSALDLAMVPSWTQAARLAKIKFAKDNPQWRGSTRTTLAALDALNQETARIVFDPLGDADVGPMMDADCTLTAFGLDAAMTGCTLGFTSISADAYAWNPATDEPPRPALPNSPAPINIVPTPVNVSVNPSRRTVAGGATAVWGVLSWSAAARTDLTAQAQYRVVGSGESGWQSMGIRGDGLSAEAGPLTDGQTYDLRVRWLAGNTPSNWSNSVTLVAVADTASTGPATDFTVSAGASQASYAFTTPDRPNVGSAQILRGANTDIAAASITRTVNAGPTQPFSSSDAGLELGAYFYWVRSLNRSGYGDASSTVGPLSAYVIHPSGNLFAATDDFTNAAWNFVATTAAGNQAAAPDGTVTADFVAEQASAGTHSFGQSVGIAPGTTRRFTIALKAGGRTKVLLRLADGANEGLGGVDMYVDLAAATAGPTGAFGAGVAATEAGSGFAGVGGVLDLGNGWVLASIRGRVSGSTSLQGRVYLQDAGGGLAYTGDPTNGVYAIAGALS